MGLTVHHLNAPDDCMWAAYVRYLKTAPIRTNVATAACVTAAGDGLAQQLEVRWSPAPHRDERPPCTLDPQRLTTVTAYWAASSPALFAWFRWLDDKFPTSPPLPRAARLVNLSKKLVVHQWSFVPLINGVFFTYLVCVGEATGSTPLSCGQPGYAATVAATVPSQLWETQKTSVVVWGVAHTFNFLFLPTHTRVLFNSSVGVLWSAYMSTVGHREPHASKADAQGIKT